MNQHVSDGKYYIQKRSQNKSNNVKYKTVFNFVTCGSIVNYIYM